MARIVISEFMDERAVTQFAIAHDVLHDPTLVDDASRLVTAAAAADALIVRNRTQMRGELLAALRRRKVVGRLGDDLDNIDVDGCAARGIAVIPATGANALSVAEYVIAASRLLLRGAYPVPRRRGRRSPACRGGCRHGSASTLRTRRRRCRRPACACRVPDARRSCARPRRTASRFPMSCSRLSRLKLGSACSERAAWRMG